LHRDPDATSARFTRLLHDLHPSLPDDDPSVAQVAERGGARLVRYPMRRFEKPNLRFVEGGIGTVEVSGGVDIIRCMNVLLYFDRAFRTRALQWAATVLKPGGLFVCGVNWARSTSSRYSVYQKVGDALVRREFSFGIECVRPIDFLSWYTLHADDAEALLLADAVRTLRTDEMFRLAYDARLDAILAGTGMCPRGTDGYLGGLPSDLAPTDREERMESIGLTLGTHGLTDAAVGVLQRAGRMAWVNCVGHVATLPDDIASLDTLESRS
jgi:SAM-dependent methyltransferase